ncbi:MAG: CerR family C-terminal domain-containing protein [Phycisphaerae bacterium]|nr:CerR family C-terminal domain-containing protein [Phycisphaerae bacterium]
MKSAKKDRDTQTRLLESACRMFAEKGYRDTTVADICKGAGANVAAVNYYFRDKETLYVEAWQLAFRRAIGAYPPDGGVGPDAPPEQRLRGRILSLMRKIVDPNNYGFEIVHRELANPTGLLTECVRELIGPVRLGMMAVIRELLGTNASEKQVQLCEMSILAQCFHAMARERRRKASSEKKSLPIPFPFPPEFDIEMMADHIVRFSLAGIRDLRQQIDSGESGDRE